MSTARRGDWLGGLLVGVVVGVLFWVFPTFAVLLFALFALIAVVRTRQLFGLSGLLIGVGGAWLAVLARATISCSQFDAAANQECIQPDLSPWMAQAAALLALGIVLLGVGWRRGR